MGHKIRLAPQKWTLIFLGFPFLLGILLLAFFGPVFLFCDRVGSTQVNCSIERKVLLGLVTTNRIAIESVTEARVDRKIQRKTEGDDRGPRQVETPVYGVLLLGNQNVVLNSYGYNPEREQAIVDRINEFLKTSETSSLVVRETNSSSNFLGLSLMILPSAILAWNRIKKR